MGVFVLIAGHDNKHEVQQGRLQIVLAEDYSSSGTEQITSGLRRCTYMKVCEATVCKDYGQQRALRRLDDKAWGAPQGLKWYCSLENSLRGSRSNTPRIAWFHADDLTVEQSQASHSEVTTSPACQISPIWRKSGLRVRGLSTCPIPVKATRMLQTTRYFSSHCTSCR